eukprot:1193711-Prorocentrum_minimum.AAC.3
MTTSVSVPDHVLGRWRAEVLDGRGGVIPNPSVFVRHERYSLSPSAIGVRYGYILSPLLRLVPATGRFSLPFCDLCALRVDSLSPSAIGARNALDGGDHSSHHSDRLASVTVCATTAPSLSFNNNNKRRFTEITRTGGFKWRPAKRLGGRQASQLCTRSRLLDKCPTQGSRCRSGSRHRIIGGRVEFFSGGAAW